MNFTTSYSLFKSRQIFNTGYSWYRKRGAQLPSDQRYQYERLLQDLDDAIVKKKPEESSSLAHQVEEFYRSHFKKNQWDYIKEIFLAVLIALIVATIVRQVWFELYEIPTGSMRPTFEEQDHLTVTKTAFGLNVPLKTNHFYFDPKLVQRTGIVIWSGDHIPHLDSDSKFMSIFPYTKRFIKRCMGKPGDTLYFYGGKIYGFDREGNDLIELRDSPWLKKLEHIPFTQWEGRSDASPDPLLKNHMQVRYNLFNIPIGRYRLTPQQLKGEIFNQKEWIVDQPEAQRYPHDTIQTYSDFWGIRNYAMARLLNKNQLETLTSFRADQIEDGVLYLELAHTPSLNYPQPLVANPSHIFINGYSTVIPLQEKHVKALMNHLYTCRFIVKDGKATAYRFEPAKMNNGNPSFAKIPNGTYEFYYGKGVQIGWGGIPYALPADHPLYSLKPSHVQKMFNVGIDMSTYVEPTNRFQVYFPSRYAYFREGDLYIMGGIVIEKDDPILQSFHQREKQREQFSNTETPYVAFRDYGPPLKADGKLDKDFIRTFGYQIPEGQYLMLGDNHAMSQDSRWFGAIPQANLQGAPSLILWPPGERWGIPNQKPYPLLTFPRLIVWSIVGLGILIWWILRQRQLNRHLFKKLY